jgi:hypothetical protein
MTPMPTKNFRLQQINLRPPSLKILVPSLLPCSVPYNEFDISISPKREVFYMYYIPIGNNNNNILHVFSFS